MSDLLNRLEEHEFPYADVSICLKPKLLAEREEAMARIAAANREKQKDAADARLASPAVNPALAQALEDVKTINDKIQAAAITLRVTGVDRVKYNRMLLQCPPRKGRNEIFDSSKFYMHVARATATYIDKNGTPHEISSQEWDEIDKKLTDGEHDRIAQAIIEVNRTVGAQDVSFFANGSEMTPDSSETSD